MSSEVIGRLIKRANEGMAEREKEIELVESLEGMIAAMYICIYNFNGDIYTCIYIVAVKVK